MDKYIGRLLDNRYEILENIGTGGMAVVYKARCHRLNRLVAIKILKDDYLQDEEFRRRFHAESQAVAMLSHPNIVSVYDVSSSDEADYIVMELIDGISLKQYMEKKGVLNWKETLHFAMQIGKALEHAHSRGVVHRDIKPHNVMVLKNGSVKVADFGIARLMSKGNTLTKEALGSVHYISPEQAKGGRVDNRSDIYSLGVVMYEMMSGRPPYDGESPVAVAIQHINGGAIMPSVLNPNIPGGLEQIIMKAMAHGIDDRYASAADMLHDMDEFRKDPAILFDYNAPPLDEVTKLQHKPEIEENSLAARTTAERIARRNEAQRRRSGAPSRRNGADKKPADRADGNEERNNRVATIAIIACSLVMVVAIVIFLILMLSGGVFDKTEPLMSVPDLVGESYDTLVAPDGFKVKLLESVYDEAEEGTIIKQNPEAGEMVAKGNTIFVTVSKGQEPKDFYMQNVIGQEGQSVKSVLESMSLNLKVTIRRESHATVSEGRIIRTEPVANTKLIEDQEIILYVSQGADVKVSQMPIVSNVKREDAIKTLNNQEMGLKILVEEVFDSVVPAGKVVRSDPAEGEDLNYGHNVTLYVSKGPQTAVVPDVRGFSVDAAINILNSFGFKNYKYERVDSELEANTVVSQSIGEEKETLADINIEIVLYISNGPQESKPELMEKEHTFDLTKLEKTESYELKITYGGESVHTEIIEPGRTSVSVTLSGTGVQYFKVLIDGEQAWIEEVDFDAE